MSALQIIKHITNFGNTYVGLR